MSSADRGRLGHVVAIVATLGLIVGVELWLPAVSRAQEASSAGTVTAHYPSIPPMPGVVQPQVSVPSNMLIPGGGAEPATQATVVEPLPASVSPAAAVASALTSVTEGAPVVQPVTLPAVVTAGATSETSSASPSAESATPPKAEEVPDAPPPSAEEILRRLRQSDAPPLTISQMAALNDAIKRAEYLGQIEQKMQEMNLGVASGGGGAAIAAPPPPRDRSSSSRGSAEAEEYPRVLRVVGARGRYAALLIADGAQVLAQPGEVVGSVRIASVALSGVRATTQAGDLVTLSFVAPAGVDGISASSRRR